VRENYLFVSRQDSRIDEVQEVPDSRRAAPLARA
jgi:hypothetical protein